jgi:hypothetical protein
MPFITNCKQPDATSIEVLLSSAGKLSTEVRIMIKDFDLKGSIRMALANDVHHIENLLMVLQDAVQVPNFDVSMLHENEMEEILLSLYARYWSQTMTLPYTPSSDEIKKLEESQNKLYLDYLAGKFTPTVDVDLSEIDAKSLSDDFKEPIVITYEGTDYYFRLPRLHDYVEAQKFIDKHYSLKMRDFQGLENILQFNASVRNSEPEKMKSFDQAKYEVYEKLNVSKLVDYLSAKQQGSLIQLGDKKFETLEDKMSVVVPSNVWEYYKKEVLEKYDFGVVRDIKIKSPFTGEALIWRAPFQYMDFISSRKLSNTSGFTVRFGENASV